MKKYYFLLLICFSLTQTSAQIVNFPDANFKNKLLEAGVTNTIAKDLNNNYCKIDVNNDKEI